MAHVGEVLKQDCNSSAELGIAIDEGVAFLEVVTDLLEKAFHSSEDSSKCTKAELELNIREID